MKEPIIAEIYVIPIGTTTTGLSRYIAACIDIAKQAQDNRKQLEKSIDRLQELLDYLRVCIKYQVFDLEATRRENQYLRKLLEENDH